MLRREFLEIATSGAMAGLAGLPVPDLVEHFKNRPAPRNPFDFPVGVDIDTGQQVFLPGPVNNYSLNVNGGTGGGKSFLLNLLISHILSLQVKVPQRAPSVIVFDPHKSLHDTLVRRCCEFGIAPDRVVIIELDQTSRFAAFNPLARRGCTTELVAENFRDAFLKAFSDQKAMFETPQFARWLVNLVTPLIDEDLSLVELQHMLSLEDDNAIRNVLVERCKDPMVREAWLTEFPGYTSTIQKVERCLGTALNRLGPFTTGPTLSNLFGVVDESKVIDFRRFMDGPDGPYVVLVSNYGGNVASDDSTRFVVALMINSIVRAAMAPPFRAKQRACFLVCDEFHTLIGRNFHPLLREARKVRLLGFLSTQIPAAVRLYDEELYLNTLANCKMKAIFGDLSCVELEDLVRDIYAHQFDADAVKFDLQTKYFHPHEETRTVVSDGRAHTRMVAETVGEVDSVSSSMMSNWGSNSGLGSSHAVSVPMSGPDGMPMGYTDISGASSTDGASLGGASMSGTSNSKIRSTTVADADTVSHAESVVPFHRMEEKSQLTSRQFRDLREQLEIAIHRTRALPKQHCLIASPGQVNVIRVHDVPPPRVTDAQVDTYRAMVFDNACYSTPQEIKAVIKHRREKLLLLSSPPADLPPSPNGSNGKNGNGHKDALLDTLFAPIGKRMKGSHQ